MADRTLQCALLLVCPLWSFSQQNETCVESCCSGEDLNRTMSSLLTLLEPPQLLNLFNRSLSPWTYRIPVVFRRSCAGGRYRLEQGSFPVTVGCTCVLAHM